ELSEDCPTLTLEQFYRAGTALAHRLTRRSQEIGDGMMSPTRVIEPLFGDHGRAMTLARALLPGPSPSLVERIRTVLRRVSGTDFDAYRERGTDAEVQQRIAEWHRERVNLL